MTYPNSPRYFSLEDDTRLAHLRGVAANEYERHSRATAESSGHACTRLERHPARAARRTLRNWSNIALRERRT